MSGYVRLVNKPSVSNLRALQPAAYHINAHSLKSFAWECTREKAEQFNTLVDDLRHLKTALH